MGTPQHGMNSEELTDSPFDQRATKRRRESVTDENVSLTAATEIPDNDENDALSNGNQLVIGCGEYDERSVVTSQKLNGVRHQKTVIADAKYPKVKRPRKLILHFDVRNTILVSDSVTKDNVEQALNAFLAGVTWGRKRQSTDGYEDDAKTSTPQCVHVAANSDGDDACGDWVWCSDRPSLSAPCPGAVTYYKGLEHRMVHSIPDRLLLRRATGDFTQQPIGSRFRSFFDEHLKLLEWDLAIPSKAKEFGTLTNDTGHKTINYERQTTESDGEYHLVEQMKTETASNLSTPKLYISGSDGRTYHYLMPSFVKMLYDLSAAGRRFTVLLRTYGVDAQNVLSSASHIVAGHHPLFPRSLSFDVCPNPGSIRRFSDGQIRCELPWNASVSTTGETKTSSSTAAILETEVDIYNMLSNCKGIHGIVDDFEYWQSNEFDHQAGKPLWIDPTDDHVQHIFFDDNIRPTDRDSIVDVRLFDGDDFSAQGIDRPRSFRSLALGEISSLENVCLVQADLLECIRDIDYFMRKVDECEVNYERWLMQRKRTKAADERFES